MEYRLSKAGAANNGIFKKTALEIIAKRARGIPRTINIICDNALVTGYAYQRMPIDAAIVLEVIKDMEGGRGWVLKKSRFITTAAAMAGLCVAGTFMLGPTPLAVFSGQERLPVSPPADTQKPSQSTTRTDGARPVNAVMPESVAANIRTGSGVTRVVKKGDTMIALVQDVYGAWGSKRIALLLGRIKKSNPHIKNVSFILEGQEVFFPDVKHETMEAPQ